MEPTAERPFVMEQRDMWQLAAAFLFSLVLMVLGTLAVVLSGWKWAVLLFVWAFWLLLVCLLLFVELLFQVRGLRR